MTDRKDISPRTQDIPDYYEYSKGSEAYKELIRWSLAPDNLITEDVFEEGLKGLETLKHPLPVLYNIMHARWEKECQDMALSDWGDFDFQRFSRLSAAMVECVKKIEISSDKKMDFLNRMRDQNGILFYHAYEEAPELQSELYKPYDLDAVFVAAAVYVAKASDSHENCYRTLFQYFSDSPYFLSQLDGIDDARVVSMISDHKEIFPLAYMENVKYIEFLLHLQEQIAANELREISPDTVKDAVTDLSAAMLETRCLSEALTGYRDGISFYGKSFDPLKDDDVKILCEIFPRVDRSNGHEELVIAEVFNACVKACHAMRDNLITLRRMGDSANNDDERDRLLNEIKETRAAAEATYNNVFKLK